MRRLALVVVLGLAGCGGAETGGDGACAAAVVHDGMAYRGTRIEAGRGLHSGDIIEDGFQAPACNDTGGNEPNRPTRVFAVRGVSPELAVIDDGHLYVNVGYVTELRSHPLHDVLHGDERQPRRWKRASCTVEGRVVDRVFGIWAETERGRLNVVINVRTRIDGFDHGGLPYFERGDAIRVRGRCGDEYVLARRIEPPS